MNVLGISADYHDSSAGLVSDGELVAAAAEERFSRRKHEAAFPELAIRYCLEQAGLTAHDLDAVVFYEQPHVKFTRVLSSTLAGFPRSGASFVRAMKSWLGHKLWTQGELSRRLGISPERIRTLPHHLSHAAQAFLGSPFDEAAILTVDAVGEWDCTALAMGRRTGAPVEPIRSLESFEYPHSLGLVYAAFTAFLGFTPNSDECSTMALASFGRPRYVERVRRVLRPQDDGSYEVDPTYFDFLAPALPFTRRFLQLFGEPRDSREPLPFDAMADEQQPVSAGVQHYADVAASIQQVLEEVLLGLARRLHARTGARYLCMAGGVALNCVAVARLEAEGPFEQVFVPPDPGDGGAALGAAQYVAALHAPEPDRCGSRLTPFLGKRYESEPVLSMLAHLGPADWRGCEDMGDVLPRVRHLELERCEDRSRLLSRTVEDLAAGRIVGWFQERFENGPRALGNRSILVAPSHMEASRRMSRIVKKRAPFRPYALSVAERDAARLLGYTGAIPWTARWMQTVAPAASTERDRVRAGLHVDGTTRPQVCAPSDNPRYHELLEAFGSATGLAALLNTSFNERGAPLVSSPAEALAMFLRTDLDTLVLDNAILRKERT